MVGYGPEDDHFVLELTYNYGIGSYRHGNDFVGIHIYSPDVYKSVSANDSVPKGFRDGVVDLLDPAGYRFFIHNEKSTSQDFIRKLELASSNIQRSIGKLDYSNLVQISF